MVSVTTKLLFQDPTTFNTPLLAVFAVDIASGQEAQSSPALLCASDAVADTAAPWLSSGEFKAGAGETLLLHGPANLKAERLLIVGLGKVGQLSAHEVRKGAGVAVRFCKPRGIRELAFCFPEDRALADEHLDALPCELTSRALLEGALVADFDIDIYRSDRKDLSMQTVSVLSNDAEQKNRSDIQSGFDQGVILGESQNFARSLVNEPGNILTPTELGRRATEMANEVGLSAEVHSTAKLQELGMGAFLAVAQGSPEPPALIVLRYEPASAPDPSTPVLGLVGKGITFDTGGISSTLR